MKTASSTSFLLARHDIRGKPSVRARLFDVDPNTRILRYHYTGRLRTRQRGKTL